MWSWWTVERGMRDWETDIRMVLWETIRRASGTRVPRTPESDALFPVRRPDTRSLFSLATEHTADTLSMSDSALPPRYAKRRAPVVRDEAIKTAKRRRVAEDSDDGMDVDPEDASGVQDARSQDTAGSPLKLKTYRKEVLQSALTQNSELLVPHECATAADSSQPSPSCHRQNVSKSLRINESPFIPHLQRHRNYLDASSVICQ